MRFAWLVLYVLAGCRASSPLSAAHVAAVDVRPAILRAVPLLQKSQATWISARECGSCHHQGLGMIALAPAWREGAR
jgi:cytochrome c553